MGYLDPPQAFSSLEGGALQLKAGGLRGERLRARRKRYHYLTKIARLGGYLARANDPPPGNTVMWRGLSRLTDIELGAIIGAKIVGN